MSKCKKLSAIYFQRYTTVSNTDLYLSYNFWTPTYLKVSEKQILILLSANPYPQNCTSEVTPHKGLKLPKRFTNLPWNHYIEWPVFSDVDLHCESQGEKGRTCRKYKILIGSQAFISPFFTQAFDRGRGEVCEPFRWF